MNKTLISAIVLLSLAPVPAAAALNVVWDAPWDPPTPPDDRVSHYAIHCADADQPIAADGSAEVVRVDKDTLEADLGGALAPGKDYDCVATSESESLGLRSAPSNTLRLSLSDLDPPGNFRVKITIEISQ